MDLAVPIVLNDIRRRLSQRRKRDDKSEQDNDPHAWGLFKRDAYAIIQLVEILFSNGGEFVVFTLHAVRHINRRHKNGIEQQGSLSVKFTILRKLKTVMTLTPSAALLFFYGLFLIFCGITAVLFIGMKAKTALVSGGTSGILAMVVGHFISLNANTAIVLGIILTFGLFCVFSWRSTKTLFALFDLIRTNHPDLKGKGIAFLIISLMAVVSIVVTLMQAVNIAV
jgi:hypothetical protein